MANSDPLRDFLLEEVERIESELDAQAVPSPSRWTYRFTWQDVERARRYRWSLPSEPAILARQASSGSSGHGELEVEIRYREGLSAYQVSVRRRR